MAALAVASDSVYALVAGAFGEFLRRRRAFGRFQRLASGVVMIALEVGAALSGSSQKLHL